MTNPGYFAQCYIKYDCKSLKSCGRIMSMRRCLGCMEDLWICLELQTGAWNHNASAVNTKSPAFRKYCSRQHIPGQHCNHKWWRSQVACFWQSPFRTTRSSTPEWLNGTGLFRPGAVCRSRGTWPSVGHLRHCRAFLLYGHRDNAAWRNSPQKNDTLRMPSKAGASLPKNVEYVIMNALILNNEERIKSADEFEAGAPLLCCGGRGVLAAKIEMAFARVLCLYSRVRWNCVFFFGILLRDFYISLWQRLKTINR